MSPTEKRQIQEEVDSNPEEERMERGEERAGNESVSAASRGHCMAAPCLPRLL